MANSNTSKQVLKLFDHKFVANTLKNYHRCPKCRNEFSIWYDVPDKHSKDAVVKSNRPVLLPCGHNMCENCVYQNRKNLMCTTCLKPVELSLNPSPYFKIRDYFDMNFFLLGELNNFRYYNKDNSANNTLLATTQTSVTSLNNTLIGSSIKEPTLKCNECEIVTASGKCRQCKVYFCKPCFESVHKASKVLKMHNLQRLDKTSNNTDMERLLKPRFCRRHHRTNDKFCKICNVTCCSECAKNDHQSHSPQSLMDLNKTYMDEVNSTLQNISSLRESIRKGLKDVKSVETKLEEYATKTVEDISDYFLQLHSHLQNEEKRIMEEFSEQCHQPQYQLRQVFIKLNKSQEILNVMRDNLNVYQQKLPPNVHVGNALEKYNQQLEHLPSYIEITKPRSNPFVFEAKVDPFPTIHTFVKCNYNDPKLTIQIRCMHDDSNQSILDATSLQSSFDIDFDNPMAWQDIPISQQQKTKVLHKQDVKGVRRNTNIENQLSSHYNHPIENLNSTTDSLTSLEKDMSSQSENDLYVVTHVKSPDHFYIQKHSNLDKIRKLSDEHRDCGYGDRIPKNITVGCYYMAYHKNDKQWYRGVLKKFLPNDVYKVFLMDIGNNVEISSKQLSDLHQTHWNIPLAALRCAIADILPADNRWSDDARSFLIELVQNNGVGVSIIEKIGELHKVDLQTALTKSVRDSFLYTGLARERPGASLYKMHGKKNVATVKSEEQIPGNYFQVGEILMVNMIYAIGPQEFYVIKEDWVQDKAKFIHDMNDFYGPEKANHQYIYLGAVNMCCTVFREGKWHRGVIEEIKDRGTLIIRLADEGRRLHLNWREIFVLADEFRRKREFSIRCTLADIVPKQENSYVYTKVAIEDFTQMAANPCLRMEIQNINKNENLVVLYVSKKNMDVNIGATLVRNNHGVSTGESTQTVECIKYPNAKLPLQQADDELSRCDPLSLANSKSSKDQEKIFVNRSMIIVTHIVDPGEFYIQLAELTKGTIEFHSKIQETQNQKYCVSGNCLELPCPEFPRWIVGSHCLVYSKYDASPVPTLQHKSCEWYRGIITDITQDIGTAPTYSVFLRDIGATIRSIAKHQLFPIDSQLDRVTNAVYCCHLAGIGPAGGVKSWSQSAIDSFNFWLLQFESLSVSLRGKKSSEMRSLPVVLWGSTTVTSDPLAPCMTKYSSFSRYLVEKGLAYNAEAIDMTEEFDKIEEMELKEGEITLKQWFKSIDDDVMLSALSNKDLYPITVSGNLSSTIDVSNDVLHAQDSSDGHPLNIYLHDIDFVPTTGLTNIPEAWSTCKDINKTLFTGYATYVDYGCIIFLHEADDKSFLEKISKIISDNFEHLEEPPEDYMYNVNQPCVARYHLDSKCYRAMIHKDGQNKKGEWNVRFLDYGNIELVEPENLRPYAPFPNLPSIANKYTPIGIQANSNDGKYSTDDLDQMHGFIVGKFVSVRLSESQLKCPIKRCTMRIGTVDVASAFIEKGWARKEMLPNPMSISQFSESAIAEPIKLCRRNPLPCTAFNETKKDYEVFDCINQRNSDDEISSPNYFGQSLPICFEENAHHFQFKSTNLPGIQSNVISTTNVDSRKTNVERKLATPHAKKRMFDHKDYTRMMNGAIKLFDMNSFCDEDTNDDAFCIDDDTGEDIVEMSHSFAMNYWHSAADDMKDEEGKEISQQLEQRISLQEDEDIASEFEHFHPNDTSTVFSHFSGIEIFQPAQLPACNKPFNCRVIKIISATVVQIFPVANGDFKRSDVEMQMDIRRHAKTAAPLTRFEPRTPCLACYSKDKKWYRAVIRSYNQIARTVEVFYVDYLNSETLPQKYVKECPAAILSAPQRTFCARLHGIIANSKISSLDIRRALHDLIAKQNLLGIVRKHPNNQNFMEICLYKSSNLISTGTVAYETLIEKGFYIRT
ncbi:tudor domain-containing protein qin isoform X2 [Haematobia irritans]|uniref:tudor domain-containing protein qin isoform X2 n=1 Tax=Haematobia irritans TaxID=7368 RepID=UPI003F501F66